MIEQKPTIGRIVHYVLCDTDVAEIERSRVGTEHARSNPLHPGDEVAAVIVKVWTDECVNLRLVLDGTDFYWATSRMPSSGPVQACWHWPERA